MSYPRSEDEWMIRRSSLPEDYITVINGFEVKRFVMPVSFGLPDIIKVCVDPVHNLFGMLGISFEIRFSFLHSRHLTELTKDRIQASYSAQDLLSCMSEPLKKQTAQIIKKQYPDLKYHDIMNDFRSGELNRLLIDPYFHVFYEAGFLMNLDYFHIIGTAHGVIY